jgi:TetR/AcrR family transcriptional regulator
METSAVRSDTRRERRPEDRPQELVAAALDLFVEKGFAATRLDDVAARAGVSKGTLYLYFDSKEALFKAVIESAVIPAVAEGEQVVRDFQGSSADLLRELVQGWWRLFGATKLGGIPKLMVSEARNFPGVAQFYHEHVIQRGVRLFTSTVQRGIDSGEFRLVDVECAVGALIGPMMMKALWQHSFVPSGCGISEIEPERFLETIVDLFLNGLRASR